MIGSLSFSNLTLKSKHLTPKAYCSWMVFLWHLAVKASGFIHQRLTDRKLQELCEPNAFMLLSPLFSQV